MEKAFWKPWALLLGAVAVCAARPDESRAQFSSASSRPKPSMTESITSGFKDGLDKLGRWVAPKPAEPKPEDDPVSLASKGRPGAELYTAVARWHEQSGKPAEAEQQYKLALKSDPNYLAASIGYARLKERLGRSDDAIALYQQAAKTHPNQPAVFNNLGLCYARRGMLGEALSAIGRAVQLQPSHALYRNNIATVLVEMGRPGDAFGHLRAVHDEAAAYYNVGYLLSKKGQTQLAAQHFAAALRANPSMVEARQMIEQLAGAAAAPQSPAQPPAQETGLASRPAPPPGDSPPPVSPAPAGPEPVVPAPRIASPQQPSRPVTLPAAPGPPATFGERPPMPPDSILLKRLPPTSERTAPAALPAAPYPPMLTAPLPPAR